MFSGANFINDLSIVMYIQWIFFLVWIQVVIKWSLRNFVQNFVRIWFLKNLFTVKIISIDFICKQKKCYWNGPSDMLCSASSRNIPADTCMEFEKMGAFDSIPTSRQLCWWKCCVEVSCFVLSFYVPQVNSISSTVVSVVPLYWRYNEGQIQNFNFYKIMLFCMKLFIC